MSPLRVALFVEGSLGSKRRDGGDWFLHLWQSVLVKALELRSIDMIVPISKAHLAAMNPEVRNLKVASSSTALRLDQLMAQRLQLKPSFDAAIVAWDLYPPWQPATQFCRWEETLRLYRLLAASKELPSPWPQRAAERLKELEGRASPSARKSLPRLERGSVLAVCMAPEFEALFLHEAGLKETLGLKGKKVKHWPRDWDEPSLRNPKQLLGKAIVAARKLDPQPESVQIVRGDMHTAPHEWASYLVTHATEELRKNISTHQISQRLKEILPASSTVSNE